MSLDLLSFFLMYSNSHSFKACSNKSFPFLPKYKIIFLNFLKLFFAKCNIIGSGLNALETIVSDSKFFSLKISF